VRTKPEDFQFFVDDINKIKPEELKRKQELQSIQNEQEYRLFKNSFLKGDCYICSEKLTRSDLKNPCLHWILREHKRIRKKQIEELLKSSELFRVIAYLRWVANFEARLVNVNDFEAYSVRKGLVYQETIKYKNKVWTFWVKDGDLKGHEDSEINFPHYHLHMTISGLQFINFGDMHIPLSEWDIFNIYGYTGNYPTLKFKVPHGETYSDLFNNISVKKLVNSMKSTKDESTAQFHLSTLVLAKDDKGISNEDINKIFAEHKKTGTPLASLANKLGGKSTTFIEPANLINPVLRAEAKKGR
jgi:hypothetical protein